MNVPRKYPGAPPPLFQRFPLHSFPLQAQVAREDKSTARHGLAQQSSLNWSPSMEAQRPLPLCAQLPRGRLIELTGGHGRAQLTTAVSCLRYAQQRGETTAWVQSHQGLLFPPDLAESGIDLDSLIVVHIPQPHGPAGLLKAAELLLRSGGFGMVVVDLSHGRLPRGNAWQGRLLSLSREHDSWMVLLGPPRRKGRQRSLGPLISVCIESTWTRISSGRFSLHPHIRKDKSALLGPLLPEIRRGPWGVL